MKSVVCNKDTSSGRLILPEQEWPFADRLAWEAARRSGDMFGEAGRAAEWSAASKKNFTNRYGRWLAWVFRTGPAADAIPPGDRVSREAVHEYIGYLKASSCSEVTIHALVRSLLTGMLMFAPEGDWTWVSIVEANLRKTMRASVDKRHQVRPIRELFTYGLRLMVDADKSKSTARVKLAIQYRDGLLIALFASRAPRPGVVTLMKIGEHLIREGNLYWMVFDETEMKGGRNSEKYLSRDLVPYLNRYLDHHRRVLLRDPGGQSEVTELWIGEHGRAVTAAGIHQAVCKRTLTEFDVEIPPHRFRDCMATSFAYEDPQNLGAASSVLDHATPTMVERHYDQAQAHVSLRRVHSNLDELREQLKPIYERWRLESQEQPDR
jgi:integrase/recombinase XerD